MKQKRLLAIFALGLCALTTLQAQENEFDLGSQRSEVQLVNPIPGKKINHHGLIINPTPIDLKLINRRYWWYKTHSTTNKSKDIMGLLERPRLLVSCG